MTASDQNPVSDRDTPPDGDADANRFARASLAEDDPTTDGASAVVVGRGTGEDAEYLARCGFETVAFDISPTAVETARARFPDSRVEYAVADVLDPPADWHHAFELVVEVFTVQALPPHLHRAAGACAGRLVRPAGTLLVLAAAGDAPPPVDSGPPWPLTLAEIAAFAVDGLILADLHRLKAGNGSPRWVAEFYRERPSRS